VATIGIYVLWPAKSPDILQQDKSILNNRLGIEKPQAKRQLQPESRHTSIVSASFIFG
jgi:hypothetical protein